MITAKLYEELGKTFVTPFRSGGTSVGGRMDTFLDFYSRCSETNVDVPSKECEPVVDCDGAMYRGRCSYLEGYYEWIGVYPEKTQEINEICSYQTGIEHDVDDLYEQFMR